MTGEGHSGCHSHPEPCFGKKTLKRCKLKQNLNDVVFIDVDGDNFHNVIIDGPKSVQQNVHDSSVTKREKRIPLGSIISIDDDENIDIHPSNGFESHADLDSDASSSKRSCPASNHSQNFGGLEADECQFIQERKCPVKFSKCKRTYSGKASSRNHYGLDPISKSTSSESDFSDSELMEGSMGKLHEQWEQAYLKRKNDLQTAKSDFVDQPSASGSNTDTPPNIEVENMTKQHQETPVCSSSSNENFENKNLPSFFPPDVSNLGVTSPNTEVENPCAEFKFKVSEESSGCKIESMGKTQFSHVKNDVHNEVATPNETQIRKSKSCLMRKEPVCESSSVSEQDDEFDDMTHTQDGQRDIINEREKLKETAEYKRVIEEEWTSRQRQLQLQAEEAQRLKKRRKAENMRLLDMERRQKQRVQEIRETQKKDEENMNIKEKLRLEVRKELDKLEMTCSDMTSLLRGLEIHVGGGFCPSANEVHAAYKRALFKFHPDRASRTDIYEQVEAEEKFKLISRMKEKFMLPS